MTTKNYYSLLGYILFVVMSVCFVATNDLYVPDELAITTVFDVADEEGNSSKKEFPKEEKEEEEDSKEEKEEKREKEEKEEDSKNNFFLSNFFNQHQSNYSALEVQSRTLFSEYQSIQYKTKLPLYILYSCLKVNS